MYQEKLKNSALDLGEILYITLDILNFKWQTLLPILIIINLPLLLIEQFIPPDLISSIFWIIYGLAITLEWLAVVIITERTILDEQIDFKLALKSGWDKLQAVLVNLLVMWIIYSLFVGLGFIFFIIPGIYIAIIYYFFSEAIVLRNANFLESFQYSHNLVKGNFFKVVILAFLALMTSGNLVTPSDFLPQWPILESILVILFQLLLSFIFYIIRIVITVSFLNLDYFKNGLPTRV